MFADIVLVPGMNAIQYDFCEKIGVMLSGNVYHDRSNDGVFDRATEEGIAGVVIKLLDENGNDTGLRATTNAAGLLQIQQPAGGQIHGRRGSSERLDRRQGHARQPGRRRGASARRLDQPGHDRLGRDGQRVQLRRA